MKKERRLGDSSKARHLDGSVKPKNGGDGGKHCIDRASTALPEPLTPVLLPGKSHGQRSPVGCSASGCQESDMTERLHFHWRHSSITGHKLSSLE